eukprot:COSAG04_NODE_147_length_22902_cov_55.666184_4_plen_311_part_00
MASSAIVPSGGSTVWAADTTMNMGGRSLTDEDLASLIVKNGGSNLQRVFVGLTRGDGTTITADQMITRMEAATQLIDNVIGVEEKKGKLKRVLQENSTAFINAVRSFRDQPEDVLLTLRPGQEELVDLILKMREAQVTVPEPKSFAPLAAAPLTSPPAAAPPVSPALKRSSAEGVPPVAAPQTASPAAEKPEEPASKAQKGSDGTDAELRRHLDRSLRAFQEHSSQPVTHLLPFSPPPLARCPTSPRAARRASRAASSSRCSAPSPRRRTSTCWMLQSRTCRAASSGSALRRRAPRRLPTSATRATPGRT